jgi:hypothetical protein
MMIISACGRGVALALCLAATLAAAQTRPPPDREQLERKLTSTSTLIESSSGARQIKASGEARAEEHRSRARDLHRRAGEALKAGDLEGAAKLLDSAALAMFDGVRLSSPEQVTLPKQRADFDARMDSTRVLLEAQKRIAAEKGAGSRAGDLTRSVESLLANAATLAANGRLGEARQAVDQAYLAVKAAIGGMREGETVVRSLSFATNAEEYHYEIDRNDTHRMLIQILLKDKRGAGTVDAMVEQALAAAAKLRAQAEQEAARRDHEAAVKTLEESTRELVKAIRSAGVYIPG